MVFGRHHLLEYARHHPAVERAHQLHQIAHLRALGVQLAHQVGHAAGGVGDLLQAFGARQAQADQMRAAGVVRQHFGHAQAADGAGLVHHHHPFDVVFGHGDQGLEQHLVGAHGKQRTAGQRPHRRGARQAAAGERVEQVGAGDDARAGRIAGHQQAVHAVFAQQGRGVGDRGGHAGFVQRRQLRVAHAGEHHPAQLAGLLPVGQQAPLHRQRLVEIGGETWVLRQQRLEHRRRHQETQRVLARGIAMPRASGDDGERAEQIARTVVGELRFITRCAGIAGLHAALEHHVDLRRGLAGFDQARAGRMETQVHGRGQARLLAGFEQVEGRRVQVQPGHVRGHPGQPATPGRRRQYDLRGEARRVGARRARFRRRVPAPVRLVQARRRRWTAAPRPAPAARTAAPAANAAAAGAPRRGTCRAIRGSST